MQRNEALSKMIYPSMRRQGPPKDGIIQIHVTRSCDLSCFGCTQGSNFRGKAEFISVDNFEKAVISLENYFGVVGVFGGNPCLHPKFETLCEILRAYIPKERCGLWCNNLNGHGKACQKTFDPRVSNLNVHLSQKCWDEFHRDWPESMPFGLDDDSKHSPPYVAMLDVIEDEEERWELISKCDVNQKWSALCGQIDGQLYGYFCEVAFAQALLHKNDPNWDIKGIPIPGDYKGQWWELSSDNFYDQVDWHCHRCGVPMKIEGAWAQGDSAVEREQISKCHANVCLPKKPDRLVELIEDMSQLRSRDNNFTHYIHSEK